MIYDIRSYQFKRFLVSGYSAKKDALLEMLNSITLHTEYNQAKPMGAATSV
jgi:hypothetical protein